MRSGRDSDSMGRIRRYLMLFAFIPFLLLAPSSLGAWLRNLPNRQVLILYSYMRTLPWQSRVMEGLDRGLSRLDGWRIPFIFEENLESSRLVFSDDDSMWRQYLIEKYEHSRIDAIITDGFPAASFMMRNRDLFPDAERYHFNFIKAPSMPLPTDNEYFFEEVSDFGRSLRVIKDILPGTTRLVIVMDKTDLSIARAQVIRALEAELKEFFSIEIWDDFTANDLYLRASRLPRGSAIFYLPVVVDRNGEMLIPGYVGETLAKSASVPVFTHYDSLIGRGIVGGYVTSGVLLGELMARIAGQGKVALPSSLEEYRTEVLGNSFDARALKRWSIPQSVLPPKSELLYYEKTFLERYWINVLIVALVFVLQTLLTLALWRASLQRKRALLLLEQERNTLESRVEERTRALSGINLELTREVADRRRAELDANRLAQEKTVLLKELQHRVKNSMTIITSLIGLEGLKSESAETRDVLDKLQSRISALASLYEILYVSGGVDKVNLKDYLERIVDEVCESMGTDVRQIQVDKDIASVAFDLKSAVSLGLIVNELVTDSLKHAFDGRDSGRIWLTLVKEDRGIVLELSDNGVGLPEGFSVQDSQGFGFQLVSLLCQQLQADFSAGRAMEREENKDGSLRGPGVRFTLVLKT